MTDAQSLRRAADLCRTPRPLTREQRLEKALQFYAARSRYTDTPHPRTPGAWETAEAVRDGGKRARAALRAAARG